VGEEEFFLPPSLTLVSVRDEVDISHAQKPVYVEECFLCLDWMTEGKGSLRRKEPLLPRNMTVIDWWISSRRSISRRIRTSTVCTKCTMPYHSSYHRPKAAWSKVETIGVFVPHMLEH